ncbi:hypothetical protein RSOCI_03805 [Rhabdochlamydiaceae symbiont of Dictyostelium giganteum]
MPNVLTQAGLSKIYFTSSTSTCSKIRLYIFSYQTPEIVAKVQTIFDEEIKGKNYQGLTTKIFKDIQIKPYLLRKGDFFELISREDAIQLKMGEIEDYRKMGIHYQSLSQYAKAIECHKKDLEIAIVLNDHIEEGRAYCNLGGIYRNLNNYSEAIKYHEKDLHIAITLNDRTAKGRAYCNLGAIYNDLENYHKAIEFCEKDLAIALEFKDRFTEGMVYNNLGDNYNSLGESPKAVRFYKSALIFAQALKNQSGIGYAYRGLGDAYSSLKDYKQAIEFYEKSLKVFINLKDQAEIGKTYSSLGTVYHRLGKNDKAIEYHTEDLRIANELHDESSKGSIYANLGNAHLSLGQDKKAKAIDYYKKDLAIAQTFKNEAAEARAYGNLGNAYDILGRYQEAVASHLKHLEISTLLNNPSQQIKAYGNLGNVYQALGEYHKAVESYEKQLKIAQGLNNQAEEASIYCNLGSAYCSLKEFEKSIHNHEEHLTIVKNNNNKVETEKAYSNLGNTYLSSGNYALAIDYTLEGLEIALELKDLEAEGRAYCNLGAACHGLKQYEESIEWHEKDLEIVLKLQDRVGARTTYNNLGGAYYSLGKYDEAEEFFCKGIEIAIDLQNEAKESQWQVTLFEQFSDLYLGLEMTLLSKDDIQKAQKALEVSDARRYRALSSLISRKLPLENPQVPDRIAPFTFQKMQQLALKFKTTFIVYSLNLPNKEGNSIHVWIISAQKQSPQFISLPMPQDVCLQPEQFFKEFPYKKEIKRPTRINKPGIEKSPNQLFKENLSFWYNALIAHLESYLPHEDSEETLTFIPDGFLAHLPFGAFYDVKKDQYLIEKYPISIAPSIGILSLLDQLILESSDEMLLMGNPTTLNKANNQLKNTESEINAIASVMGTTPDQIFIKEKATANNLLKQSPDAKWIHIACHGVIDENPGENPDPYSVFKGLFKLTPDESHPSGDLRSQEIALMTLDAELVFMSSCHLGRGNLKREGSIGPIWSFLGAGIRSTIASYWPVLDSGVTIKMVETFYTHLLKEKVQQVSKVRALREAILVGMKENRDNIKEWGAFFLSGLVK